MRTLSIDLETYSSVDLKKCGVYKYVESDDFEILLFGYSVDGGEVKVVDLANGEKLPKEVMDALTDEEVTKWAFNASFERVCLSRWLSPSSSRFLNPSSWRCSMVWAATMGLPQSLEGAGMVLGLDKQKLQEGKDLIRYFCQPCTPTKSNNNRTRNRPSDAPDKWERFKAYNARDVEAEMEIQKKLGAFPVSDDTWDEYHLSEEINDRGIAVDMEFVRQAIRMDGISRKRLTAKMRALTNLANPNSVQQLTQWLRLKGVDAESLGKKEVAAMLADCPESIRPALELRLQLAKSSVKKYAAMENAVCADGRARGMFRFYGANRTGRFAGRLIQLQNLPQNHLPDLAEARALVKAGNSEMVEMLYGDVPDTLSQLIRTAFIPRQGKRFIVCDFSAIEARVIAWLAGEKWRLKTFEEGNDIYCASASQMFKVPVVKNGENGHLRQKGKIAELALGYGGSVGALKAMGALDMGLKEDELQPLVTAWRDSNPMIVKLWREVDKAVKDVVRERTETTLHNITFSRKSGMLFITLPSGRSLVYIKPRVEPNSFGSESVTYEGVDGAKKWGRLESYGPKFVENIVQGIARDILCYALHTLHSCDIVAHVHDELIIEAPPEMELKAIAEKMGRTPPWAEGLLLRADGYITDFYRKD